MVSNARIGREISHNRVGRFHKVDGVHERKSSLFVMSNIIRNGRERVMSPTTLKFVSVCAPLRQHQGL